MRTKSVVFALGLFLLLLGSQVASAQVSVRIGGGYYGPPRAYYGPRYYPPRPPVVYAPAPVIIAPAPYYAPRPVYYAPRPNYGYRGRGRRW
ncbi:hypothetical protein [Hymenobacter siberiensis]|uniref:hypothetical protein n=1 Tax=Hymenobacter siberiensis TaxID=2848396 RepID=UPI001C1DECFF|nr:hypothetical protein [Hymenobacter siberiensis]